VISVEIVQGALNLVGLDACVKKRKPLLSQKNIQDYSNFAKSHKICTIVDWKQVVFQDETKVNCFCSYGGSWCWARDGESLID